MLPTQSSPTQAAAFLFKRTGAVNRLNVIMFETETAGRLRNTLRAFPIIHKIFSTGTRAGEKNPSFPFSGAGLTRALQQTLTAPGILLISDPDRVDIRLQDLENFWAAAKQHPDGSLFYADYYSGDRCAENLLPVIDYQPGSIRDDFDFGPVQLAAAEHVNRVIAKYGPPAESKWAGLYDLRLKLSLTGKLVKIHKPLSRLCRPKTRPSHFDYLTPDRAAFQKEMEQTASRHLKQAGAFCNHEFAPVPADPEPAPVLASIMIPVKNREKTILDALKSALGQKTDFRYNVLVVQNHSTDRTGEKIDSLSKTDSRIIPIVPKRRDLGIGGCWNEAVASASCGKYVCQLDSDDLYRDENSLTAMIEMLATGKYGMVVGAYRVVDFNLKEIPPGIVDHREWTETNGRNNLLRVNGIGAPRAFPRILLRQFPFPNVSYGEDYAVALRISRDYRVGRIFDPLYLCRRWAENSDARLTREQANRYARYKDRLRSEEITARQHLTARTG